MCFKEGCCTWKGYNWAIVLDVFNHLGGRLTTRGIVKLIRAIIPLVYHFRATFTELRHHPKTSIEGTNLIVFGDQMEDTKSHLQALLRTEHDALLASFINNSYSAIRAELFSGPSYAVDTACSSSLAAIHVACNVLWRNEADTMIVGGTNIITNPDFTAGLDKGHFLSRTGNCKTFDDEADGYCRGEGVGTVILKRLEDAILDGDNIKGVIANVCTNHSAESESITRPHLKAQRDIFTKVLDGLDPSHVSYVEMHGTGTQVGDATEMGSVLESIALNHGRHLRSDKHLVHVGSVKANVGHGEAAAGVTSLQRCQSDVLRIYNTAARNPYGRETGSSRGKSRDAKPSVIFAFTGQGGSYVGTGRDLYLNNSSFKTNIDRYNQIALNQGFSSFLPIIQDSNGDISSFDAITTQLAILGLQVALTKLWISWGVTPSAVVGHSLGHYAALVVGGVISKADALFVVGIRAQQLQEGCKPATHGMLAVRASSSSLALYLDGTGVEVACINGPQDTIFSSVRAAIELLHARLASDNIRGIMLDVPYAFHSSQVDGVLERFRAATSGIQFHSPQIPVLCGQIRKVVRKGEIFGSDHLVDHFRQSVDFVAAIEAAQTEKLVTNNTIFVEIGHNSTVTAMLLATLGNKCRAFPSLKKNQSNWSTMTAVLEALYMAGDSIRWDEYHRDFARKYTVIELPQYQWDLKSYWLQHVNDWSLRKGDGPEIRHIGRPSMLSTTIHSVLREDPVLVERPARPTTSIVIQQSTIAAAAAPSSTILFLFPDGSGSASSYTSLAQVSQNVTLIGLICPYRRDPAAMTISLTSLITSYVAEIRRRQPKGPYSLGGWSSGGIYAYRASQMLLDVGSEVRDLVLVDSPPPNEGLERLPERFYRHCAEVGIFAQIGGGGVADVMEEKMARKEPPGWLVPHFNATIDLLSTYHAEPLHSPRGMAMPKVSPCWAGQCALDGVRYAKLEHEEGDGEGIRFLSEQRTDFGSGKGAELIRGVECNVEVIRDWDHFNMMCSGHLGSLL
ncbi:FabD/lysophospholipase-like protein [Pleomassaria siparia CBS 279.74]|uniref:FabD/lysophospholipase-like protein n=1 Tax=Pleomassaria siparia CBS 279.74 TaxID=1314801 RepID=A0A6G1K8Y4_9PLEO|nr:FabD/lysophospholipase-like protein [Pleomassaria siparia CBS 279.74]